MTIHKTTPQHEALYQALCKAMNDNCGNLTPMEILAIVCNLVGKLVALQDQRKYTVNECLIVVEENIAHGNKLAIEELMASKGSA